LGVIHMNGRIYDPLVGRFMSADPYIQDPQNLQSHNRYAYVMNNPLALTDPSGYFSWGKLFGAMLCPICVKERQRPILIIGLSVASGQWFISLGWAPVAAGAASGFITGFASTGNVNGAMQGAFSGGLFGAAGMVGDAPNSFARYAAHAAAGCISAVASSGHCGPGAVAAVFGKYTTNAIGDSSILSDSVSKGVAASVAGGIGSVIAGGKFENGAVTAAYGYIFNAMMARSAFLQSEYGVNSAASDCECNRLTASLANAWQRFTNWVGDIYDTLTLNGETRLKPPPDSRPIDQTDWSGDHTGIKGQSNAGPRDNVRITPSGEVWVQRPGGDWENTGNANDMVGGSGPSGRRGRDREPPWKRN